jgi:HD-GYP domain-containing protein (c-di-GMP phosphodiesterase class II)
MSDNSQNSIAEIPGKEATRQQTGFLPVPLRDIPLESLEVLNLHLKNEENYLLYRSTEGETRGASLQRLMGTDVDMAYVPVEDQESYYQTIEPALSDIIADPYLQPQEKSEILYSTLIALVDQLHTIPPSQEEIQRVAAISRSMMEMFVHDENAFKHLFDISNHDFCVSTHVVNVCTTMVAMAQRMEFDSQSLQDIGTGALLHDIGRLFIPPEILETEEKFIDKQFEVMETHVDRGAQHLEDVASLGPISMAIVAEHHERLDGSGYPRGLKGDEISVYGRMAAVADTFEAMTSVRPYRGRPFTMDEVFDTFDSESPIRLDKGVINAFRELLESQLLVESDTKRPGPSEAALEPKQMINRRKRFYFRMPVQVRKIAFVDKQVRLGPPEQMMTHNMSRSGLGLLGSRPLATGQHIHITVTALQETNPHPLIAAVVCSKDHGNGWYTIGARFHQLQSNELIEKIRLVTPVTEELTALP